MKKKVINFLALSILTLMSIASCNINPNDDTEIKSEISINIIGENSCYVGDSITLVAEVNGSTSNVIFSSSNRSVATVSQDGVVTGISEGTCYIYAKLEADNSIKSFIKFTVTEKPKNNNNGDNNNGDDNNDDNNNNSESNDVYPTSISLPSTIYLEVNETYDLSLSFTPYNTTIKEYSFESSDESICTIENNGKLTALSAGEVIITAYAIFNENKDTIETTGKVIVSEKQSVEKTELKYSVDDLNENSWYGNQDHCPTKGNPKLLIIPVWFSDSSTFIKDKDTVRNDIENAYFGNDESTGWKSTKSYYETLSKNKLSITGKVTDWYETTLSYKTVGKYGLSYSSSGDLIDKTGDLVDAAVAWYFKNNPDDSRKNYDTDSNGHLDGVVLIYGAPDYYSLGNDSYSNLWAYTYWRDNNSNTISPTPGVYFRASYDFMYSSGNTTKNRVGSKYGTGDTTNCIIDAHTYIHEMGHVLGLEDYYDYSGTSSPAGGFSMQDENVGGHDPFSTLLYGYSKPYIPTSSCTITINSFQESNDLILLTPCWNSYDSPFDEYLLLELYTPTGLNEFDSTYTYFSRDKGPNEIGIRLWHVDSRLATFEGYDSKGNEVYGETLTSNPKTGYVGYAMSNTTYSSNYEDYCSPLGEDYYKYNVLQLIRNSTKETYTSSNYLSSSDLFKDGDSFSIGDYSKQFQNGTLLNSSSEFNWSFTVSINEENNKTTATITLKNS